MFLHLKLLPLVRVVQRLLTVLEMRVETHRLFLGAKLLPHLVAVLALKHQVVEVVAP
jgi:hypothetical protein